VSMTSMELPRVQPSPPPRTSRRRRLARAVTEVFAPAPTVVLLLLLVAWHSAPTAAEAMKWGLLAALFASILPFLYIVRGVRRRQFTDHHVGVRAQRPLPLPIGVASVVTGLLLLVVLGAPRELVALVGAMVAGLAVSTLITLFWKISIHVAVTAGALVILILVFGLALIALAPLVALVGWARVEIGDHTPTQVLVGTAVGAAIAAVVFSLLR
jgi:membrane-associated phospholipid phosphatase